jgi:hypothetical protein
MAAGDFDGDGHVDLVTGNFADALVSGHGGVSLLLGNGDGTFKPARRIYSGEQIFSIAVADLDRDGHLDVVTANPFSSSVGVMLGLGGGAFGPRQTIPVSSWRSQVRGAVAVDFNRDGIIDLVTADSYAAAVSVLLGKGDGTFPQQRSFAVDEEPLGVAVADVNGDGLPDIATANFSSGSVSVLLSLPP